MDLCNCITKEELKLKDVELLGLTTKELLNLAKEIKKQHEDCVLEDETIVISVLSQTIEALCRRVE